MGGRCRSLEGARARGPTADTAAMLALLAPLSLFLVTGTVGAAVAQEASPSLQGDEQAVLERLGLEHEASWAQLILWSSDPIAWSLAESGEHQLVFRLHGTRLGPGVPALLRGGGLTPEVSLEASSEEGRLETLIRIQVSEPVDYWVSPAGQGIRVTLRPRAPAPPATAGPAPPPPLAPAPPPHEAPAQPPAPEGPPPSAPVEPVEPETPGPIELPEPIEPPAPPAAEAGEAPVPPAAAPAPAEEPVPAPSPPAPAPPPSLTAPVISDAALGEGRRREDLDGMILVEGGVVTVGLDPPNARFYNQSPAFEAELAPFWIDETPISAARVHATHPGLELPDPRETGLALGVSQDWAEAYCRFLGKRLPSEIEWEAAMVSGAVSPDPRAFEWTASWYQPYPGNEHTEPEYGEELKVIRGGMDPEHLDLHERRHLDPQMGHRLVGFRCARDAGE